MLLSLKNLQKNYPGFSLDVSMEIEEEGKHENVHWRIYYSHFLFP